MYVSTGLAEEKKKGFAYQEHYPVSYAYQIDSDAENCIDSLQEESEKLYNKYIKEK